MTELVCPNCGPRSLAEFTLVGPAAETGLEAGWLVERWRHHAGCGCFVDVERNLATGMARPGEPAVARGVMRSPAGVDRVAALAAAVRRVPLSDAAHSAIEEVSRDNGTGLDPREPHAAPYDPARDDEAGAPDRADDGPRTEDGTEPAGAAPTDADVPGAADALATNGDVAETGANGGATSVDRPLLADPEAGLHRWPTVERDEPGAPASDAARPSHLFGDPFADLRRWPPEEGDDAAPAPPPPPLDETPRIAPPAPAAPDEPAAPQTDELVPRGLVHDDDAGFGRPPDVGDGGAPARSTNEPTDGGGLASDEVPLPSWWPAAASTLPGSSSTADRARATEADQPSPAPGAEADQPSPAPVAEADQPSPAPVAEATDAGSPLPEPAADSRGFHTLEPRDRPRPEQEPWVARAQEHVSAARLERERAGRGADEDLPPVVERAEASPVPPAPDEESARPEPVPEPEEAPRPALGGLRSTLGTSPVADAPTGEQPPPPPTPEARPAADADRGEPPMRSGLGSLRSTLDLGDQPTLPEPPPAPEPPGADLPAPPAGLSEPPGADLPAPPAGLPEPPGADLPAPPAAPIADPAGPRGIGLSRPAEDVPSSTPTGGADAAPATGPAEPRDEELPAPPGADLPAPPAGIDPGPSRWADEPAPPPRSGLGSLRSTLDLGGARDEVPAPEPPEAPPAPPAPQPLGVDDAPGAGLPAAPPPEAPSPADEANEELPRRVGLGSLRSTLDTSAPEGDGGPAEPRPEPGSASESLFGGRGGGREAMRRGDHPGDERGEVDRPVGRDADLGAWAAPPPGISRADAPRPGRGVPADDPWVRRAEAEIESARERGEMPAPERPATVEAREDVRRPVDEDGAGYRDETEYRDVADGVVYDDEAEYDDDGAVYDDEAEYDDDGAVYDDEAEYDDDGVVYDDDAVYEDEVDDRAMRRGDVEDDYDDDYDDYDEAEDDEADGHVPDLAELEEELFEEEAEPDGRFGDEDDTIDLRDVPLPRRRGGASGRPTRRLVAEDAASMADRVRDEGLDQAAIDRFSRRSDGARVVSRDVAPPVEMGGRGEPQEVEHGWRRDPVGWSDDERDGRGGSRDRGGPSPWSRADDGASLWERSDEPEPEAPPAHEAEPQNGSLQPWERLAPGQTERRYAGYYEDDEPGDDPDEEPPPRTGGIIDWSGGAGRG
ncbi:MAG: hypothetical protein S0880_05120 [Actinomycetota bacterium]|nr:hypothetical protein [Actinomycetota bacterium]